MLKNGFQSSISLKIITLLFDDLLNFSISTKFYLFACVDIQEQALIKLHHWRNMSILKLSFYLMWFLLHSKIYQLKKNILQPKSIIDAKCLNFPEETWKLLKGFDQTGTKAFFFVLDGNNASKCKNGPAFPICINRLIYHVKIFNSNWVFFYEILYTYQNAQPPERNLYHRMEI